MCSWFYCYLFIQMFNQIVPTHFFELIPKIYLLFFVKDLQIFISMSK